MDWSGLPKLSNVTVINGNVMIETISSLLVAYWKEVPNDYCRIYVKDLLALGVENGVSELRPQKYSVVGANLDYSGEIQVGVTFTQKVIEHFYSLNVNKKKMTWTFVYNNMLLAYLVWWNEIGGGTWWGRIGRMEAKWILKWLLQPHGWIYGKFF